jgi:hypothetical protein
MQSSNRKKGEPDMGEIYEIRLRGHLSDKYSDWFNGMTIRREDDGTTTVTGQISDQTALHSILFKIRNMNIGLISVNSIEPNLGEG